jgi:thiol-disulfide isomerase/thioredoxin
MMMKSKNALILVVVFGILLILGIVFFFSQNQPSTNNQSLSTNTDLPTLTSSTAQQSDNPASGTIPQGTASGGQYIAYSPEGLGETSGTNRILYFYANWCPTCRPVDADLKERISEIPAGVTIIRVNYNDTETDQDEKALAQKYGITYQHTFVQIDKEGNEIQKWNGGGFEDILDKL